MPCPTVRVKDANSPDGFVVINESDLTDHHEVVRENSAGIQQPIGQPTVFDHTAEAPFNRQADLAPGQTVVIPGGTEIPGDWENLHWKRQVKLARNLGWQEVDSGFSAEQAKEFIRSKVAERDGN